jgi:hypothetical protein
METHVTGRIHASAAKFVVAILAITAVLAVTAGAASAVTYAPIYKNIPSTFPGNSPSQAFEATSTSEFGGRVEVESATKDNTKVTVAMSSWACQSGGAEDGTCVTAAGATFSWPVTLKIYLPNPNGSVGPQIAQLTKTFKMPYRPSANPTKCPGNGGWYQKGNCYHGKLFKITFPLQGVYLSDKAIVSVAYNTSNYGAEPQGPSCTIPGCPYDSLNVGVENGFAETPISSLSIGEQPLPNDAYLSSTWTGAYCNGAEGTGTFRLDPGCWGIFQPLFEVTTG